MESEELNFEEYRAVIRAIKNTEMRNLELR